MAFDFKQWIRDDRGSSKFTVHPDYDGLPECIKHLYTVEEYAWLTESQRNRLIELECYPDVEEED